MTGHAFIVHETGWACSNEVWIDIESDMTDINGMPHLVQTKTIKANGLFNGVGEVKPDDQVQCVMITDGDTKQYGFLGRVRQAGNLTVINILGQIEDCKSIIKKIK